MDIPLVLERLLVNADYTGSLTDNTEAVYNALVWNDARAKPTWAEITAEWIVYVKEQLFAHLATYRYNKEVGGIVINTMPIPTDDRTKTLLVGAYNSAIEENDPTRLRHFKVGATFVLLDNAAVISIALAIAEHVQQCFEAESEVAALIEADTLTTEAEVEDAFDTAYAS